MQISQYIIIYKTRIVDRRRAFVLLLYTHIYISRLEEGGVSESVTTLVTSDIKNHGESGSTGWSRAAAVCARKGPALRRRRRKKERGNNAGTNAKKEQESWCAVLQTARKRERGGEKKKRETGESESERCVCACRIK